jgi:hypothetical protein
MGNRNYLNDKRQFAIDYCERKMSEEEPARITKMPRPSLWSLQNTFNGVINL